MDFAVVMLQKEVAHRLLAQPGTKEYGSPTVMLASCANVRLLLKVHPNDFHPRPKIDSVVVRIEFHPRPERVQSLAPFDRKFFSRVVHAAFGQRRKTLLNALDNASLVVNKNELAQRLEAVGISPSARAETLTLENFVQLSRIIIP
jgi:16S rRNA (adenine1518-N6/adenine1519-N6)-dimethyltransferase